VRIAALVFATFALVGCKKESGGTSSGATTCDDRVEAFEQALASSTAGACSADADCRCYPGGVSKNHGCGGVTDAKTGEKLLSIASDYQGAGCKSGIDCAASMCLPSCRNGRCSDGPPPKPAATQAEAGITCDARTAEIDKLLASAPRKCVADKDCACFRGGVSKTDPCGGVVDAKTNERFEALAKDWTGAGCKGENVACPAVVCQSACTKGVCGASGMIIQ